jgi:hypothetical protein
MTTLYLLSPHSPPHAQLGETGLSECGRSLDNAVEITAAQALVYLGDSRCPACFPSHAQSTGKSHHRTLRRVA